MHNAVLSSLRSPAPDVAGGADVPDARPGFTTVTAGAWLREVTEIPRAIDAFEQAAGEWGLPMPAYTPLCMVLDELLNNIITYAYGGDKKHEIAVAAEHIDDAVILTITDDGAPFNPFSAKEPDTTAGVEEREIGGLGIHLVKEMADDVSYQRRVDRNVVKITKKIPRSG